jgi:PHD/YefM family antitoxin component YafN of YafNO toxin-antitoxin module
MIKVPAAEFQRNIGRDQDMALTQPVAVTRNGRERTVMISAEEYQRLKRRDRRVLDDDAAVAALRGRDDRTFDLIFINAGIFPPECATRRMLAGTRLPRRS